MNDITTQFVSNAIVQNNLIKLTYKLTYPGYNIVNSYSLVFPHRIGGWIINGQSCDVSMFGGMIYVINGEEGKYLCGTCIYDHIRYGLVISTYSWYGSVKDPATNILGFEIVSFLNNNTITFDQTTTQQFLNNMLVYKM